jgi:hypothetical protein
MAEKLIVDWTLIKSKAILVDEYFNK